MAIVWKDIEAQLEWRGKRILIVGENDPERMKEFLDVFGENVFFLDPAINNMVEAGVLDAEHAIAALIQEIPANFNNAFDVVINPWVTCDIEDNKGVMEAICRILENDDGISVTIVDLCDLKKGFSSFVDTHRRYFGQVGVKKAFEPWIIAAKPKQQIDVAVGKPSVERSM